MPQLATNVHYRVKQLEAQLNAIVENHLNAAQGSSSTGFEQNTIARLRNNQSIVITKSDKSNRIVVMDAGKYDDLYTEHMANYEEITRPVLPSTLQATFNRRLSLILGDTPNDLRAMLACGRCSEPLPCRMIIVPKDHKDPLKGRPLVAATDTPGTNLARVLASCLKPLLQLVGAHLANTSMFVAALKQVPQQQFWFGSFDVTNLYGNIPRIGTDNVFDVVTEFFDRHREHTILRGLPAEPFKQLLVLATTSDVVEIRGALFRQRNGLAMGNNLAPCLAIIYMNALEEKLRSLPESRILAWHRYIDDVFVIAACLLQQLLPLANSLSSSICFTSETPVNSGLPFLDTYVTFNEANWDFSTAFYSKSCHSNSLLHFDSHVPLQRKIALLKCERLRIQRTCSNSEASAKGFALMQSRFALNGYPQHLITRYLLTESTRRRRVDDGAKVIYLRVPFINDTSERQIRAVFARSDLPVRIQPVFITARPLAAQLQRRQSLHCGKHCICKSRRLCMRKNVVYEIQCMLCNDKYIGETHRTYRSRILEHLKPNHGSNVFEHFRQIHHVQPSLGSIHHCIREAGFTDALQRKTCEASIIARDKPAINIQLA